MANHWYVVTDCKTEGCEGLQLLAYLGAVAEYQDAPPPFSVGVPMDFHLWCPTCSRGHGYRPRDMKPHVLEVDPRPGMILLKNGTIEFPLRLGFPKDKDV